MEIHSLSSGCSLAARASTTRCLTRPSSQAHLTSPDRALVRTSIFHQGTSGHRPGSCTTECQSGGCSMLTTSPKSRSLPEQTSTASLRQRSRVDAGISRIGGAWNGDAASNSGSRSRAREPKTSLCPPAAFESSYAARTGASHPSERRSLRADSLSNRGIDVSAPMDEGLGVTTFGCTVSAEGERLRRLESLRTTRCRMWPGQLQRWP